jgi:hypothetical protein
MKGNIKKEKKKKKGEPGKKLASAHQKANKLMGPAIGPHSPQLAVPKRQCNKTKRRMSALISNILRLDSQRGVSPKLNCRSHNNKIRKKRKTFWPTNANSKCHPSK